MKLRVKTIMTVMMLSFLIPTVKADTQEPTPETIAYFEDVVNTGKDNGYSGKNQIVHGDPHFGWKLGKFTLTDFSEKIIDEKGNIIILKNSGDNIVLNFNLQQNIDKLNGDKNLRISTDKNGYNNYFGIKQTNFGRGTLIIRQTESNGNKKDAKVYTGYLKGKTVGANIKTAIKEEGDYEVELNYEIIKDGLINKYTNYKIYFKFSVRNSNAMIFPMDVKTKSELINEAFTENGFYIDFAKSQYLDVSIKKEVLKEGTNGLVEDVRFNKSAKPGEKYTEEGIYTITAKNKYKETQTVKKIYVGKDNILKAHVQTGYSVSDIKYMVELGATIDNNGKITNIPSNFNPGNDDINFMTSSELNRQNKRKYIFLIIPLILAIIYIAMTTNKNKNTHKIIEKKVKEARVIDYEEKYNEDKLVETNNKKRKNKKNKKGKKRHE